MLQHFLTDFHVLPEELEDHSRFSLERNYSVMTLIVAYIRVGFLFYVVMFDEYDKFEGWIAR